MVKNCIILPAEVCDLNFLCFGNPGCFHCMLTGWLKVAAPWFITFHISCVTEMHHPPLRNAASGSNSKPHFLAIVGKHLQDPLWTHLIPQCLHNHHLNCPKWQQIPPLVNVSSDDSPPVLLHQSSQCLHLYQQHFPRLAGRERSFISSCSPQTFIPSMSLLSSTHICHHTLPSFCNECRMVDILPLLGTESLLDLGRIWNYTDHAVNNLWHKLHIWGG